MPVQVPLPLADPVTYPLYTSEDEGATTEVMTPKKKNCKRGSRGKRSKIGSQSETCDSGSETASLSSSTRVSESPAGWRHSKKKGGVNNKVHIPEFDGKTSNTEGVGEAFRRWSRSVSYYRDFYEDEYLMAQIIGALKGDAADVFDFACHHGKKAYQGSWTDFGTDEASLLWNPHVPGAVEYHRKYETKVSRDGY